MTSFTYKTEEEVIDAARHIMESRMLQTESFLTLQAAAQYFQLRLGMLEREVFCVMFLNNRHQLIATEDMFLGTVDAAGVYPREVVKRALQLNASATLLSHNHPSGTLEPSEADKRITRRIVEALAVVDVRVNDHIIVSGARSMSFAERGLL